MARTALWLLPALLSNASAAEVSAVSEACAAGGVEACSAAAAVGGAGAAAQLRVDRLRLWDSVLRMAEEGAVEGPMATQGVRREALTDADRDARLLLDTWSAALDLQREVDAVGNTYYRRLGRRSREEGSNGQLGDAVAIGSHLDSPITGGRFSGVFGLLAGLEVLRLLHEHDVDTNLDVEIVNWSNEEGSRFSPPMMGSAVASGVLSVEAALATPSRSEGRPTEAPTTFGEELRRHGLAGRAEANVTTRRWIAYLEPRLEQGSKLQMTKSIVGLVSEVPAERVLTLEADTHCANRMAEEIMKQAAVPSGASLSVSRWAPSGTAIAFDTTLRAPSAVEVDTSEHQLQNALERVAKASDCARPHLKRTRNQPPIAFDVGLLEMLRASASALQQIAPLALDSGGHDALHVASRVPSALLFVPGAFQYGGVGLGTRERATSADLAMGAEVLLGAVLRAAGA